MPTDTPAMTDVSIQELKQNLSAYLSRAEAGEALVVTRHGKPLVRIVAVTEPEVVVGPGFGKTKLRQVVRERVGDLALRTLDEDRRDRFDEPKA
ncbi:MAG: type II toxin-antitoxin system prevent-host-death family antitoxin [Planctomycetes bacterium]|nr:type II toxin-antitoxin system prevent-host-death family antitoxin [Planctomycetota bacterium]